jgi:hypothetical protein
MVDEIGLNILFGRTKSEMEQIRNTEAMSQSGRKYANIDKLQPENGEIS